MNTNKGVMCVQIMVNCRRRSSERIGWERQVPKTPEGPGKSMEL